MGNLHPATQLMIVVCLFMVLGVPVLAWFTLVRRQNDLAARWWYLGLALSGLGVLLVVHLQRASAYTALCMVLSIVFCIRSMRLESTPQHAPPRRMLAGLAAYAVLVLSLDWSGHWQYWGVLCFLGALLLVEGRLLYEMFRVGQRYRSRGLVLASSGLSIVMAVNLVRWTGTLAQGQTDSIFSFAILSNAAIVSVTVAEVLMTLGYATFTLEKAHLRHVSTVERAARAEEQTRLAQEHARELKDIIAQRDEMIVLNSRFQAVSSLAMFNSAIVHEISQPAQALMSILDTLSLKPLESDVKQALDRASTLLAKMADTLNTLRGLIAAQPPDTRRLELNAVVEGILPILRSEARRRGHALEWEPSPTKEAMAVEANKVLLERILFNLVTNSFEALESPWRGTQARTGQVVLRTTLAVRDGQRYAVVHVQDDGPGIPPGILAAGGLALRTAKDQGVGLGLALARMIAQTWRGHMELTSPANPATGQGALVSLWTPLA